LYGDRPPLPNPTVIDRPGLQARIIPWLAWLERVEGLVYYSTTDWNTDPWLQPWFNDGNGDGFLFYPPKNDGTLAFNACNAQSNRLVPSMRWELLREGMEDYEYLWLLNKGAPQIGVTNPADTLAGQFITSRTRFSGVPLDLYTTRAALASQLTGAQASKLADKATVGEGETFHYLLVYNASDTAHSVTISDTVPAATTVITATGSKGSAPVVAGQTVSWTAPVASQETVTLTIEAQAVITGLVVNRATFSGTKVFTPSLQMLVYASQVYLPVILK
jgi:hypothetical protein